MPISHCIVSPAALDNAVHGSDPAEIWARLSDESVDQTTVTLIRREQQYGKSYPVMALLFLPPNCSEEKSVALKLGLANALASHFSLDPVEVYVITRRVESAQVIEGGEILD